MKVKKTVTLFFILGGFFGIQCLKAQSPNTYSAPASANTIGEKNLFLGAGAGASLTAISNSTFVGYKAGASGGLLNEIPTTISEGNNTFVGFHAGDFNIGLKNSYFGSQAGANKGSGSYNSVFGADAGTSTSGTNNTGLGAGSKVGGTGSYNTVIGSSSGNGIVAGSGNTFIGATIRTVGLPDFSNTLILAVGSAPQYNNQWRMFSASDGKTTIGLPGFVTDYAPTASLDVFKDLRVRSLPITTENTYFLSADASGHIKKQLLNMTGAPSNLVLTEDVLTLSNPLTPGNNVKLPNIYNTNGTLKDERIVAMNNNRLIFDTEANGRIYIGNTLTSPTPFNTSNFPAVTDVNNNYKLLVEGGILTEKVKIALRSTVNWADYVFANDYKLMPLQQVETFVKENKHLPGIESADELVKGGLDLGDMQAKQMGKIEELTLYAIEQQKTLEKQNKEIEELKAMVKVLMDKI